MLASQKVKVLLFDRNDPINTSEEIKKFNGDCFSFVGDVTKTNDMIEALTTAEKQLGPVSIWINNAGVVESNTFLNLAEDFIRSVIDINLTAVILGTQIACNHYKKHNRSGVVVNVASISGIYPFALVPVYSTTKSGVVHFTRALAPLAQEGIRVLAVCPSFVDTPLAKNVPQQMLDRAGGLILPSDIAKVILRLIVSDNTPSPIITVTKNETYFWPDN